MERNQVIGMVLILGLTMSYLFYFNRKPPVPDSRITDTTVNVTKHQAAEIGKTDDSARSAALKQQLGNLAVAATGTEEAEVVENENIQITFNSRGGKIEKVLLKNYLTDKRQPLYLYNQQFHSASLKANTDRGEVDLQQLYYKLQKSNIGDTTVITYSIDLGPGKSISQVYKIAKAGYVIGYKLNFSGVDDIFKNDPLKYTWNSKLPNYEYDLEQSRIKTTINYYTEEDGFDYLTETSKDKEAETLKGKVNWISMKEKFFCSALISEKGFEKAYVESEVPQDTAVVKNLHAEISIPIGDVKTQKADFKFYFGPNHYHTLKQVTQGFEKNVYLGWPVVNWINRFIVIPTFDFLDNAFGDMKWKYGLIIFILGLLVKIILLPLSYKSYIAMAKMKVMKPELDALKEKHGDDMAKIQSEQMSLYNKVGINPMSGCIPVLLSMPVLLALFSFFPNSIELRQEDFLWAADLSTYDAPIKLPFTIPFYGKHVSLFTFFMTLSTLAMTLFNSQMNTATGPMKSVSYIMPVVFMFILNNFPAGLSFYYLVANVLTIAQQAIIKKFVDEDKIRLALEENRKKIESGGGGGKKSSFMSKIQDAMKAQEELRKQQQQKGKKS